ncbi:hypothetical protein FSP39_016019 [Pinctada imbricata]|uniref:Complex 1 LYR protein domain-containing protein n=1 Tax=Pinctada imbricata TaxID=66713 RepID=A0AA88XV83_PINIB|nr:hypothetical protein FSP39_016019 [Pinctada imbricata]
MSLRQEALSVYRRAFRLARTWQSVGGDQEETLKEREYIKEETRRLFRKNKNITNEEEIKEHMREANTRIEMAIHYQIPYPRIVNIPQNVLAPTTAKLKRRQKRQIEESKPVYWKSYSDSDKDDKT